MVFLRKVEIEEELTVSGDRSSCSGWIRRLRMAVPVFVVMARARSRLRTRITITKSTRGNNGAIQNEKARP
jgi:hypothetical protein